MDTDSRGARECDRGVGGWGEVNRGKRKLK